MIYTYHYFQIDFLLIIFILSSVRFIEKELDMKIQKPLLQQIKKTSLLLFKAWGLYLIITGLVIGIGRIRFNIPVWYLTKDPNALIEGGDFYFGALSNLGIILWTIAATLCFFSTIYLKRYAPNSSFRLFLFHGGFLTTLLLLDDVYMWHEQMFPVYFGISTYFVYATYLIYAIYFIVRFRKIIFKTEYLILLASILLMALSVLIDVMHDSQRFDDALLNITGLRPALLGEITVLLEETSKGLGILTWLIYFSRVLFINVLPAVKHVDIETLKRKPISTPVSQEIG